MGISVDNPVTFINQTSKKPSTTGVHLALIRSHTTTLQHKRAKRASPPTSQNHVLPREDEGSRNLESRSRNRVAYRQQRIRSTQGAEYNAILINTAWHRPHGMCQRCLLERSGSLDVQTLDNELCLECFCLTVKDAILGRNSRVTSDSLRNDPFDTLPVPADNYVNNLLDYCEFFNNCKTKLSCT